MLTPEQSTQIAICDWLKYQYPRISEHVIKIDNEGIRSIGGHVKAKRMGLHIGASDLFIAWPTLKFYGLFLEIKPDGWKGPKSKKEKERIDSQIAFINKMVDRGYFGQMVAGFDEASFAIENYLGRL